MELQHKELLEKCYQNLVESITDADRVVDVLAHRGALSQPELLELGHQCVSGSEKVDLLLKILMSKDRDCFAELCEALEATHPHLNPLLLDGVGPVDHTTGSTYSVLSTMPSDSESSSSLSSLGERGSPGTSGQASSPLPGHVDVHQANEKMETVLLQLRQVTRERDELLRRVALPSGNAFEECRLNSRSGHDYERLKLQCMKAMADLQSLQNQHSTTLKRCEEAVKKADFYRRLASDHNQLKEELEAVRQHNIQLVREHNHVKQTCEELRRLHDEDERELADMKMLHQQVMREGSSDVLNKLYEAAVDKLDAMKSDYEALRKRYNEKIASHNAELSRLDQLEEENHRLQKTLDILSKQRDAAIHYQQQFSTSVQRFDNTQHELSKATVQNLELQRELERLQSEATRLKTQQLKAVKDCEKYKEERDSVISEYRLIMSERDQVIKEVDRLQTGLEVAEAKLMNNSSERRVATEELEALQQELASALVDRDRAICEKNELLEKYCHEVKDKAEAQKELNQACKDIEMVREERDVARKERTEAIIQRDQLLREYYQARQKQDSATLDMERANKEIEILRKQYEAISQELKEALQEAEVAKCRRDWAFQERDKIVAERESIRTLCDNLRRERDRAVSDLADALRNLDDTRKQKNDAVRDLKELKEKLDDQLETEARYRQLMAHSSHDSAIDTDSIEWETEVVELEKHRDMDLKALGFDITECVNDPYLPGDCGIFVSKVDKGSIAEGRLRVNDWLLKINDVDLTNKDRKQVLKAVLSREGVINMVVRRRKSLGGRVVTSIQINLAGHKDCGIGLESGVFVATLAAGSPAARDCNLAVGDRLLAINGNELHDKSLSECESLLRTGGSSLTISLMKFFSQSSSGQNLFEALRDSEKTLRLQSSELHPRGCRNSKHNCSTQTDICSCKSGSREEEVCNDACDSLENSSSCTRSHHKSFSNCSQDSCSPSISHSLSEPYPVHSYQRQDLDSRSPTFTPLVSNCNPAQPCADRGQSPTVKAGGGTWPKVIAGASVTECTQLSIFKKPKQRKSIFDVNAFRRPETAPKLDYMSLSQMSKHSPQSSVSEAPQTPPTPPTRSDSFRFKHRQQNSSASDCTITTNTPPASLALAVSPQDEGFVGSQEYYTNIPSGKKQKNLQKPTEEEESRGRTDMQGKRRYRPKSAPALRRNVTPLHIPVPMQTQSFSNDEHSPEPVDLLRFSPLRSNRYMVPFAPQSRGSFVPHQPQRRAAPCPAMTAVMRNPVYTAWSHEIQNCPPVPSSGLDQHTQSPQHQGLLSLDFGHKRNGHLSETTYSQPQHSTKSLPSGARLSSSGTLQYRAERIKIPLAHYSRSTGSDKGSLSHSECSSPTPPMSPVNLETSSFSSSQSQSSVSSHPRISVSPAPVGDRRKDGPFLGEPRNVTVQKGAEPLGISIVSGENGGVFVSKVTLGSIAHQAHLEYGDQLLEFNGINLRNANEQQARLVIGQQCDVVTILAQYNPHMFQLGNNSRSSSQMESISTHLSPGIATVPDNHAIIDPLSEQDDGTMTPPSRQTTPATSPHNSFRVPGSLLLRAAEPRLVRLKRIDAELGLQICGGNICGIFLEMLDDESPLKGPDGLLPGDLILEYNGISMKNKTKEDAYLEMLKPTETVMFKVQNCVDSLADIKASQGDGFFIRALYERVAEAEQELSFKKDDILYVEDTLPNGNFGYWMAWQLDENAQRLGKGQIPSKYMMDQEFYRRHGMADMKDENGTSKSMSAAARRSFFRRRLKNKRNGSKDGKELMALDNLSTDSLPIPEDGGNLMYQRVQKVDCSSPRPVLILGPLVEACKDLLVTEAPANFCRCLPEIMKASQQAIERGVKDCVFIDYKRRSGHFDVTTVASIKEIIEKDCHCLLDIAPYAIERLHSVHIYPIVIFIRYKNAKQIKEQKDPLYLRDKLSQKHSKEQFEAAQKMEQEYSRFFTGVVQGGSVSSICTQILTIVEHEQNKVLWIPDRAP
ncbi:PREDICTED: disks large homolog 5-like isoform X1 [Cyprinodon variegatus]|uniref:Discs, large homolog 5b (Drosophila), tandem duplicate 1 n=1 Tax=Cyprinodon variegatus TaxID=28743 RepID=A0A3Q2GRK5_CYPVA|nr:PREDICTED: disks large homolog 5-like isoform X1 [Cyprinodon variegatus]